MQHLKTLELSIHNANINAYYDSEAVQFFEKVAQQQIHLGYWDDKYPHVSMAQAAQRLTQVVIDHINIAADAAYLDIGCGCGLPAIEIIKQKSCRVEGITINQQQKLKADALAIATGFAQKASFQVGDASALPYADQQFDGALFLESIHHIGHQQALEEVWRVLKPGSTVLIADGVVLKDGIKDQDQAVLAETFVAKSLLKENELITLLAQAGFHHIEVIDLTNAIQPTWSKLLEETQANKTTLIAQNGADFFQTLLNFWQKMKINWSQNAKYLIVKAKK